MPQPVASLQEFFGNIHQFFIPKEAAGVTAVYQWEISGEGGGDWWAEVNDGAIAVHAGKHEKPSVSYKVEAGNYLKIVNGQMNGRMAALTGKLKVSGSIPAAYRMQKFLPTL